LSLPVLGSLFDKPHTDLAEIPLGCALLRRLLGAGVYSLFQLVGLAL